MVALTVLLGIATFVIFLPIPSRLSRQISADVVLGSRTKSLNCRSSGALPDFACTPGQVTPGVTQKEICTPGYVGVGSEVSSGLANQVYLQYGVYSPLPGQYQIDHLIGESLGGSNDISNLWPQSLEPRPGFYEKDRVEKYLHDEVCAGRITLQTAREQIAADWLKIFLSMPSF